jgi:hypothetical protein
MLNLWFGLDASGFDKASECNHTPSTILKSQDISIIARFDPVFGPILMVTYACLSNTLLLTGRYRMSDPHRVELIFDLFSVLVSVFIP